VEPDLVIGVELEAEQKEPFGGGEKLPLKFQVSLYIAFHAGDFERPAAGVFPFAIGAMISETGEEHLSCVLG